MSLVEKPVKPSTITFLCYLNGNIQITKLFPAIPIVLIYDDEGQEVFFSCEGAKNNGEKTKPRITLPFYGESYEESFVIGVRWNGQSKGIRRGGRCFNNVVALDFQCCGKNIHVKVSQTKFTFTGILHEEMGRDASLKLCAFLNMVSGNLNYLQKVSFLEEKVSSFYKNGKIEDERLNAILSCYHDREDYEEFLEKINFLRDMGPICTDNIQPFNYQICTKAYMHELKSDKPLYPHKLAVFLLIKGFVVDYDNINPADIMVFIESKSLPGKFHCVNIHRDLKIRHNSPASEEENDVVYKKILGYLCEYFEENKSFDYYCTLYRNMKKEFS